MTNKPVLTTPVHETSVGAHAILVAVLGATGAFALADGTVALVGEDGAMRRVEAHPGAGVLVAAADETRIVTGGDDGRVVAVDQLGAAVEIVDEGGKWIDAVATRPDGATAWSIGKTVRARDAKGGVKSIVVGSSVRGLCFFPKGYRLAITGYNGVQLWFPNALAAPEALEWRGSHLGVTVAPDNRFVVSSMQENALHGWRVADRKNMRMTGYPTKTRSFSWSRDGLWLATSGADACIVWPFVGKDGPMGKAPLECAARKARVTQVAFHPKNYEIAIGYDDGWILRCRLEASEETALRAPDPVVADPVSALAWNAKGDRLYFGTENGAVGIADLRS